MESAPVAQQPKPPLRNVWFQLIDEQGHTSKSASVDMVELPPDAIIVKFRDAVKAKYADSRLKGIAAADLAVYKNNDAFVENQAVLRPGSLVEDLDGR